MLTVARGGDGCPGCAALAHELDGPRVVETTDDAVAYVPEAARWPYEVHVVPRRHAAALGDLSLTGRLGILALQASVLRRLDAVFGRPTPYMAGWLTAPTGPIEERWHLRLQIVSPQRDAGKLKYLAGSESLAGAFINDVRPEEAAARLREAG